MTRGSSTSMKDVEFILGSTTLRIPKAYLSNKLNWSGGRQEVAIEVVALLPDMEAKTLGQVQPVHLGDAEGGKNAEKFDNRVHIYLNGFGDFVFSNRVRRAVARLQLDDVAEGSFGLAPYSENVKDDQGNTLAYSSTTNDDYLYAPENSKRAYRFRCVTYEAPNAGCRVMTDWASGLNGQYIIRKGHLKSWREIDEAVAGLVNSFLVQADNGP